MTAEFLTVTEIPGNRATREQIERLHHRYHFASLLCRDQDVLEAACGAGMGLGYLARVARRVVGGDIDEQVLSFAERQYRGRPNIEVRQFDGQSMPFPEASFDVVLLYEAIYYLPRPDKFFEESKRVLRPGGHLVICSVNKDWPDFNPSPHSVAYYSAAELRGMLSPKFSKVEAFGAFPVRQETSHDRLTSFLKRTAVRFRLMPRTMKGKELFKRIFFGRLISLPAELIDEPKGYRPPEPIPAGGPNSSYKIIYLLAKN